MREKNEWVIVVWWVLLWLSIIVFILLLIMFWWQFVSHQFTMIQNRHIYQECTDMVEKGLPLKSYCWDF